MKGRSVVLPGETLKWCSRCETEKPIGEFSKNRSRPDGLQNYCKPCAYAAHRTSYVKNRDSNREAITRRNKAKNLRTLYGMSITEYDEMIFEQNNKCAICHNEMDPPHVDHNHVTGEVRALLCGQCNVGLGMFKEDEEMLSRAISYLVSFRGDVTDAVIAESLDYVASKHRKH